MSGKILSSRFVHRPRYEILQVSDFEFAEQSSLGKQETLKFRFHVRVRQVEFKVNQNVRNL